MGDNNFKQQFTTIKGVSEHRRLPRLGKIRLGIKVALAGKIPANCDCKGAGCYKCTRPKETDYFVCPPEVVKIYGPQPKKLDVMFLVNDPEVIFPQAYKHYGSGKGLKCTGNGEKARYANEAGEMVEKECPCSLLDQKKCNRRAALLVSLPKVNLGGIYQIDLGSWNSIVDINYGIDTTRAIIRQTLGIDRFAMMPLTLERVATETHHDGHKQTHYTLRLTPNITVDGLQDMKKDTRLIAPPAYTLPPVEEINPEQDDGGIVVVDQEEKTEPPAPAKPEEEKDELTKALEGPAAPEFENSKPSAPPAKDKAPQAEDIKVIRSRTAMLFGNLCKAEGVIGEGAEKLRHLWVETFYAVGGLKELDDKAVETLYRVLSGGHKLSDQKISKIRDWIKIQKPLVYGK